MSGGASSSNEFFVHELDAEPQTIPGDVVHNVMNGVRRTWRVTFRAKNTGVIVLVVAYLVWFIHLSLALYWSYGDPPFDLAIFDQGLWLISHFHVPFVTIMGRNLFGDHTSFVLYLFAPFYRLFPEPQGLLVLQTFLLASPAVPIYLLACKYLKSTLIATGLVATYLLSPLIQQGNLDQFHPEAFQALFISLAIYAAIERKKTLLIVMVILALTVKEDAAVLIIPLGVWVAARRDRRLGLSIVAGSVAWAMVANWLIIPSILGSSSIYAGRIPFGGISGFLSTIFRHPGQVVSYLGSQDRPFYLWQIAATVGFAFLFAPEVALIGILVVAENMVSNDGYMHQILYQYSIVLAAVLVLGTLYAIAQQTHYWRRNALAVVALTGAIWTCALWGYAPFSENHLPQTVPSNTLTALGYLESKIPPNAVVSAWYPLVAHIDARTQIYVWPNPFFESNWGLGQHTGATLPVASQVQYLFLPISSSSSPDPVFNLIASQFRLIQSRSGFALYKRIHAP